MKMKKVSLLIGLAIVFALSFTAISCKKDSDSSCITCKTSDETEKLCEGTDEADEVLADADMTWSEFKASVKAMDAEDDDMTCSY
jgi:hypothetical protein